MFKHIAILTTLMLSAPFTAAIADQNITIIAPTSEAAEGLDLYAVSELFKETSNLEEFEEALNNPNFGINNLDLDGNGQVDFIRVVEEIVNGTHIIVLQAAIWEDEFQDVATIEVEYTGKDYNMHVQGNEVIYGANYYIAPSHVHINTWPIINWIYRPVYRPYHSAYYWGNYPGWWKSHRPLHRNVYHGRTVKYTQRNTFVVTRTARVKNVTRVKYKPRTSVHVTNHIVHKKPNNNTRSTHTNVRKTNIRNDRNSSSVNRGNSSADRNSTSRTGVTRTTQSRTQTTTVTKSDGQTSRQKVKQKTTVKKDKKKAKAKDDKDDDKKKSKKQ
jgi:hypothetical protein